MFLIEKIFGDQNKKALKPYISRVDEINSWEPEISALSDETLANKTTEFKDRLSKGETLDDILAETFAVVREVSKRKRKERHYDVQLIGGMILHDGKISEMRTGEGKTLVATLPAYLNALTGHGVHIVTVNDYLSRRDAVWMGEIYSFLGLSVGVINHDLSFIYDPSHVEKDEERDKVGSFKVVYDYLRPCTRKEAYAADITYGTNNQFGFDYLFDNTEYEFRSVRQREYNFAIVDEIDSILIDEARTPLIISMPTVESEDLYVRFAGIANRMKPEVHYKVDEKFKSISITDEGIDFAEKELGVENIYTEKGIKYVHHLETAVRAKALFSNDVDYVVREDEIIIVDTFTGRLQPGRRWSDGLHQAIEAKEGVKIQRESRTFASITFQNYFRLYKKLGGMTGTAITSQEEFLKVYGLDTIAVPTNKINQRKDHNDLIFQTESGKFSAVAKRVKELNKNGQPVLIGTVSIEKNEILSEFLKSEGVQHQILNAKNHEREGEIIAQAGRRAQVTVATNMAGRGIDIKLGGVPFDQEEYDKVKNLGGLVVIGTERHEARRIDNQLRGRAGRQGDPGETQFFVSLEDSLMRIFATDTLKTMMGRFNIPEDQPIENGIITRSLEAAQTKIEGFHFDSRKQVLEYDDVLNHQRKTVYDRRRKILSGNPEEIKVVLQEMFADDDDTLDVLDKRVELVGEAEFYPAVKRLLLQTIDLFWVDHLEMMDYLRGSVNLRAYGQRDPLVEYKKEGLKLFRDMQVSIADQVAKFIPELGAGALIREEEKAKEAHKHIVAVGGSDSSGDSVASKIIHSKNSNQNQNNPSTSSDEKLGRNDPCPCGSGKKYKKCCGK
ncbi:MAG: preprotein translocase subunit SecA [Candidatus Paceibacterota bacterium]